MGAVVRTSLHAKGCADAQYEHKDDERDKARVNSRVVLIGNGKHDEDEDEGADKLPDYDERAWTSRSSESGGLTSSKKQLADDT